MLIAAYKFEKACTSHAYRGRNPGWQCSLIDPECVYDRSCDQRETEKHGQDKSYVPVDSGCLTRCSSCVVSGEASSFLDPSGIGGYAHAYLRGCRRI